MSFLSGFAAFSILICSLIGDAIGSMFGGFLCGLALVAGLLIFLGSDQ
jgi:hypothetical protein